MLLLTLWLLWNHLIEVVKNLLYLFRADNSNWASRYKALEKPANTKLKQMNKLFDDLAKEEK